MIFSGGEREMRQCGIWEMVRKRDREIHTQDENEIDR